MSNTPVRTVNSPPRSNGPFRVQLKNENYLTFLHIPKTAGSSIQSWVYELFRREDTPVKSFECYDLHLKLKDIIEESYWGENLGTKFTVVRNPYVRYISLWNFESNYAKKFIGTDFVTWWRSWDNKKAPLQSEYWKGCDIVIPYENLQKELDQKIAIPFFEQPSQLGKEKFVNKSYNIDEVDTIIPKEIREEIYELDKETFDNFGYERC